ncbi:phage regulatory protein [Rhizobium wuzhouense]|uniref:Phage regulatory protein n=1 Tax=Rhizobium wuzhouense TaxID=1986026 RepID=A0ABX5NMY4_9HYPH|nr:phage regulatory protein [Rhizobium wuzhouense]
MSSREIAELTGKLHTHVMRDIRSMLEDLNADQSKFGSVYIDAKGEQRPCFNLPKRETMILVSGYSVALRARIVDRWM